MNVNSRRYFSIAALLAASLFGFVAFTWPFFLPATNNVISPSTAKFFALALTIFAIVQVFYAINHALMDSKTVALLGILVALDAALRLLGAGAIGLEPMWFLLILAARIFGAQFGFSLGALAMATSALLTGGIGPWLPFQMFAAAWVGCGAGLLPKASEKIEIILLSIYGVIAGEFFGLLMDMQLWPWLLTRDTQLSYLPGAPLLENVHRFVVFHLATSMAWNIPRAILTALLIVISGRAILTAFRRARLKLTLPSMVQTAV